MEMNQLILLLGGPFGQVENVLIFIQRDSV